MIMASQQPLHLLVWGVQYLGTVRQFLLERCVRCSCLYQLWFHSSKASCRLPGNRADVGEGGMGWKSLKCSRLHPSPSPQGEASGEYQCGHSASVGIAPVRHSSRGPGSDKLILLPLRKAYTSLRLSVRAGWSWASYPESLKWDANIISALVFMHSQKTVHPRASGACQCLDRTLGHSELIWRKDRCLVILMVIVIIHCIWVWTWFYNVPWPSSQCSVFLRLQVQRAWYFPSNFSERNITKFPEPGVGRVSRAFTGTTYSVHIEWHQWENDTDFKSRKRAFSDNMLK